MTRLCFCDERLRTPTFLFSTSYGGWYFVDAPTRDMSPSAAYYAFVHREEYRHPDHRGEPMIWHDCPFCGGSLPGTRWEPSSQADGNKEVE